MGSELVVDTGPLLEGFRTPPEVRCFVVDGVLGELRRHGLRDHELASLDLVTAAPDEVSRRAVEEAAQGSGDAGVLSPVDVELLALAHARGVTLVTDDYAIQNVAAVLGLRTRSFHQRPISEQRRWVWVCKACRSHRGDVAGECPVCGSTLRRTPR